MKLNSKDWSYLVYLLVLLVMSVVVMPVLYIWAANTLFGLAIPYTIRTWLAALVLASLMWDYEAASKHKHEQNT